MRYRVYLWKSITSQVPEVVQEVQEASAEAALQQVMRAHHVPYASYAWVVPEDDDLPCVDGYRVRCPTARRDLQ
jgi:hypothetical protein